MVTINEQVVLAFYMDQIQQNNIKFLANNHSSRKQVEEYIQTLLQTTEMHNKIEIAKKLWKTLFSAAMQTIDPDRQGYNQLYAFFDDYVTFEELIFASDSFYRDHTLHCLWVYFLTEYFCFKPEFQELFASYHQPQQFLQQMYDFFQSLKDPHIFDLYRDYFACMTQTSEDAVRCIISLTHDLGYPITKIVKINKSINRILPYFSINKYNEYSFQYDSVQQIFIHEFLENISYSHHTKLESQINLAPYSKLKDIEATMNLCINNLIKGISPDEKEIAILNDKLNAISNEEIFLLTAFYKPKHQITKKVARFLRYTRDFEVYTHGIMSAYLLVKLLGAFANLNIEYSSLENITISLKDFSRLDNKLNILHAITDHTSEGYRFTTFGDDEARNSAILIFIDEIEEFSRISRANQNRQYINEFCTSEFFLKDGFLHVTYIFDKPNLLDVNPEITFKGKCKKLLDIVDIPNLDPILKFKVTVIGQLSTNNHKYELLIMKNAVAITIDGKEQKISQYLKSYDYQNIDEVSLNNQAKNKS